MQVTHTPTTWDEEINWIYHESKGKSMQAYVLKVAYTGSVYEYWRHRNEAMEERNYRNINIGQTIIEIVIHRM